MQSELAAEFPIVKETWSEAGETLGFDLWQLVCDGPDAALNETVNTQPAMLTAGVAAWRAWLAAGGATPGMMAGHSLGEYTAMVAAGALSLGDAVELVRRRAELMRDAVPTGEGAVAAILGLDDDAVQAACEKASAYGVAEAANFNSPGQVVVAGDSKAIAELIGIAKAAGARRAIELPVSVPVHTSLMRPAGEALAAFIDQAALSEPAVTIISAVDGTPYRDASDIRERIKAQVYSPVRWVDTIAYMAANDVSSIVECGPGKVLTGLVRRIDRSIEAICLDSPEAIAAAVEEA